MYPIADTLIAIGLILIILGISFALGSFKKKEITEKIHDNERIGFLPKRDKIKRLSMIVSLKHRCKIHVQVNPTSGPFDFWIEDFVGYPLRARAGVEKTKQMKGLNSHAENTTKK